eukprot:766464-Hanusia_phi.AAC.5
MFVPVYMARLYLQLFVFVSSFSIQAMLSCSFQDNVLGKLQPKLVILHAFRFNLRGAGGDEEYNKLLAEFERKLSELRSQDRDEQSKRAFRAFDGEIGQKMIEGA